MIGFLWTSRRASGVKGGHRGLDGEWSKMKVPEGLALPSARNECNKEGLAGAWEISVSARNHALPRGNWRNNINHPLLGTEKEDGPANPPNGTILFSLIK
jgi:hypothetical protein